MVRRRSPGSRTGRAGRAGRCPARGPRWPSPSTARAPRCHAARGCPGRSPRATDDPRHAAQAAEEQAGDTGHQRRDGQARRGAAARRHQPAGRGREQVGALGGSPPGAPPEARSAAAEGRHRPGAEDRRPAEGRRRRRGIPATRGRGGGGGGAPPGGGGGGGGVPPPPPSRSPGSTPACRRPRESRVIPVMAGTLPRRLPGRRGPLRGTASGATASLRPGARRSRGRSGPRPRPPRPVDVLELAGRGLVQRQAPPHPKGMASLRPAARSRASRAAARRNASMIPARSGGCGSPPTRMSLKGPTRPLAEERRHDHARDRGR